VCDTGFKLSSAVIVLLTPDEHAVLRTELRKPTDGGDRNKTGPVGQPRPNVLYELGYAMRASRNKTIVVLFGGCRVPSDMYGLHTIEHSPLNIDHS
jgi:predicted nucleotide-binding protein